MTRTNATTRSGSSRARRRFVILPVVLALAVAPVAPALATSGSAESNYATKPPAPTTTPNSGTSPSKSSKTPASSKTTSPATASSSPTTTTSPAKASSLPFTGFDLRWTVGGGLLLIAAGGSIMVMQRRQRRDDAGL
jgi:uncharacterized surface anchored protein